jgi:hypothetical protein
MRAGTCFLSFIQAVIVVLLGLQLRAAHAAQSLFVHRTGPDEARVERVTSEPDAAGNVVIRTNSWVQLEDGLNYWDTEKGVWAKAREEIELTASGAIALHGQHRAIFSSNVNDPAGALDIEVQHEVRLRSSVLAISYFDPLSGQESIIATVRDTQGELLPPNQVIYRNAFEGLHADVVYTYRKRGVEADVVLREVPPSPSDFGMAPETARIEVYTEFLEPPRPTRHPRLLATIVDPQQRGMVAEPDWVDEELDFGLNRIAEGRAFAWSAAAKRLRKLLSEWARGDEDAFPVQLALLTRSQWRAAAAVPKLVEAERKVFAELLAKGAGDTRAAADSVETVMQGSHLCETVMQGSHLCN